jgi:hypothetical protein
MKNFATFLLLLSASSASSAMDESLKHIGSNNCSKDTLPVIYFPHSFVVYIGNCKDREDVEKIYGEQFPLNTPFFQVSFRNIQKDMSLFPMYIAYKLVKNKKEGDNLSLTLNKKSSTFLCAQVEEGGMRRQNSEFQDFVTIGYKRFLQSANCLVDGEDSLIAFGVIKRKGSCIEHGQNGTKESLPE